MAGRRLVIVEDHHVVREGLALLLARRGWTVAGAAQDAAHGLALIAAEAPDVALVDIALGGGAGVELTREAVARDAGRRVVLYAGLADDELVAASADAGASGYALKEATPDELAGALESVADGHDHVDPRLRAALLSPRSTQRVSALTPREREIIALLAEGLTGEQVAVRLVLSAETVRTHVRNAMTRLEASTRAHAIAIALREGHIDGAPVRELG